MNKNIQKGLYRILTATALTLTLMIGIFLIETAINGGQCSPGTKERSDREKEMSEGQEEAESQFWFFCELEESILLDSLDGFSLLVALFLFLLETPDRTQQAQYEAWQVVDAAHGLKTSYARIQALQDLNEDEVSMKGLEIVDADLRGINLVGADLSYVNLTRADLRGANLSNANLTNTNLTEADLSNANLLNARLTNSNLSFANFVETNLTNVDFVGSNLLGSNFVRATLDRAYFGDANFIKANLKDASVKKTKFFGVQNLSAEQIRSAINWKEAIYDTAMMNQLGL